MSDPETVLLRLRGGELERLLRLLLDHLLDQPLDRLLPPERTARLLADALVRAAEARPAGRLAPELEPLHRALLQLSQGERPQAPFSGLDPDSRVGEHLPAGATAAMRELLALPWVPERELVLRLVDHQALRALIEEILRDALLGFGKRLRSMGQPATRPRRGRLGGVLAVGASVASAMGAELERQLEIRSRDFAPQALSRALAQLADALSSPAQAEVLGDWRAHALATLLDARLQQLLAGTEFLEPERVAPLLDRLLAELADWSRLEGELRALLGTSLAPLLSESLGSWLDRAGLREAWTEVALEALLPPSLEFLEEADFQEWLEALLAPGGEPS